MRVIFAAPIVWGSGLQSQTAESPSIEATDRGHRLLRLPMSHWWISGGVKGGESNGDGGGVCFSTDNEDGGHTQRNSTDGSGWHMMATWSIERNM